MDFDIGFLGSLGVILGEGELHDLAGVFIALKEIHDLGVCVRACDAEQRSNRELALPVDAAIYRAVSVCLDFHPYTACWNDLGAEVVLAFCFRGCEENAE